MDVNWTQNCDDALLPSYKWGPEEPALFNAYQARLRNRGLVPMSSRFPVRFVIPRSVPQDAVLPVMFAAEPVKPPSWQPFSWRRPEGGHVDRVWSLPPNLPALDLNKLAIPMPKHGDDAAHGASDATSTRRASLGLVAPPPPPAPPAQVRNFLPTLNPNSLGPQFSDSPMRFGLLGRLFIRRHEGREDVIVPAIPTHLPDQYLNPKQPPMAYPVQPGGPITPPPPPPPEPGFMPDVQPDHPPTSSPTRRKSSSAPPPPPGFTQPH